MNQESEDTYKLVTENQITLPSDLVANIHKIINEQSENLRTLYNMNTYPLLLKNNKFKKLYDDNWNNIDLEDGMFVFITENGNGSYHVLLHKHKKKLYEISISGLFGTEQSVHYIKDIDRRLNVPDSPIISKKKRIKLVLTN
tara:strand:+ start:602 stop:1027 length:426 start_codon:yes stop_codon:yes gene_type:complete